MKLIKFLKSFVTSPVFIIVMAIGLIFIRNRLRSEDLKSGMLIGVCVLFTVYFILEIYSDVTKKQFTTVRFIVIIEIIQVFGFLVISYLSFKCYDKSNLEILWRRYKIISTTTLILSFTQLINVFLKSRKFEIGKDEME